MDVVAAAALLGLLLVKEAGLPVPVPGDLLVIGAGVSAAGAGAGAIALLVAILLAGYVGGTVQFLLVRGAFRRPILAILRRVGVPDERLDRLADWLRRRGARGVATARATPGVRVGAIAASGLAAMPFGSFVAGLVIGNGLFVSGHFVLGLIVGPPATALVSAAMGPAIGFVALFVFAALGAAGWLALRHRRPGGRALAPASVDLPTLDGPGAWADAACPACLAIGVIRGDRP